MKRSLTIFGVTGMYWEEFYASHIRGSDTSFKGIQVKTTFRNFDSIEDLRQFDSDFLLNVDSKNH